MSFEVEFDIIMHQLEGQGMSVITKVLNLVHSTTLSVENFKPSIHKIG